MGAEEFELLLFHSALLQVTACHCSLTLRSRRETQQERGKSLIAWSHTLVYDGMIHGMGWDLPPVPRNIMAIQSGTCLIVFSQVY